jgi:hypothetical protein
MPVEIGGARTRGDKMRVWLLMVGIVAVLGVLAFGALATYEAYRTGNTNTALIKKDIKVGAAHHLESVKQDRVITELLKEHSTTLTANKAYQDALSKAESQLATDGEYIGQVDALLCTHFDLGCPAPPSALASP